MTEVVNTSVDNTEKPVESEDNILMPSDDEKQEGDTTISDNPIEIDENSLNADKPIVGDSNDTANSLNTSVVDSNQSKSKGRRNQRKRARARKAMLLKSEDSPKPVIKISDSNSEDTSEVKKSLPESGSEKELYAPELKLTIVDEGILSRRSIEFRNSIRLQEALEDAVFSGNTSFVPKFHGSGIINGVYNVTCYNVKSVKWLRMTVERLPPLWLGARLRVLGNLNDSSLRKVCVFVPGTAIDPEIFLRRLTYQNPKLDTDTWKIFKIQRKNRGQVYFLGVDEESLIVLKELDYQPFYGLKRLKCKLSLDKKSVKTKASLRGSIGRTTAGRIGAGSTRPRF